MKPYDNKELNEAILILWNDIKGELIPEHEKLTKFGYAINAWTKTQEDNKNSGLDFKVVTKLVLNGKYKIKDSVDFKATENVVKYCGTKEYNNHVYYNFFDDKTRLFHFIDPDTVELVEKK